MHTVIILPLAKQDIKKAANWYNEKQKGLGLRFTKAVRSEVQIIQKNPAASRIRYKETHTAVMSKFPFMIHYFIDHSRKAIVVTTVFHTSLNPDENWTKR
jgi:plasmid stabilization system protein ParE